MGVADGGTAMSIEDLALPAIGKRPWNKGLLVGQKRPLMPKHVWSIRVRLEMSGRARDLALFNLGIDSSCGHATW
ncbi:hypothetical protein D3C83_202390 [compost metagenome]